MHPLDDPELMALWYAPTGTPLPTATGSPLDPAFRPAGQIERNLSAVAASQGVTYDLVHGRALIPAVRLTLRWPHDDSGGFRLVRRGRYVSLVFDDPQLGRGVAARVRFDEFTPDPYDGGRLDVTAELADGVAGCVVWYRRVTAAL